MRQTKILATLGPASTDADTIAGLVRAGVDAFRFNFSHGTHAEHQARLETVRGVAAAGGRDLPVLQDLQGPKIRVLLAGEEPVTLCDDETVRLAPGAPTGEVIGVQYPPLCDDVREGEPILLDDGKIILRVETVEPAAVVCRVVAGGRLSHRKGMNLPGTHTSLPPVTEKDRADLAAGLAMGCDAVALSFVQDAADIRDLRDEMDRRGRRVPVIAKLERPQALDRLDDILAEADGVMVARGDLGIELPVEQVPVTQKRIIEAANRRGILVITATQMLESMTREMTPTRAEVTDVANAVYDGTDVVMLSGETSTGRYPVDAVRMMGRIIDRAEEFPRAYTGSFRAFTSEGPADDGTTAHLAAEASRDMDLRAICVYTRSGRTARLVSKFRPGTRIYAFCPDPSIARGLELEWGVTPIACEAFTDPDRLVRGIDAELAARRIAGEGERVAIVFGAPLAGGPPANMLRLHDMTAP